MSNNKKKKKLKIGDTATYVDKTKFTIKTVLSLTRLQLDNPSLKIFKKRKRAINYLIKILKKEKKSLKKWETKIGK